MKGIRNIRKEVLLLLLVKPQTQIISPLSEKTDLKYGFELNVRIRDALQLVMQTRSLESKLTRKQMNRGLLKSPEPDKTAAFAFSLLQKTAS